VTELPDQTDILIVGAGPAGLSLAIALRQLGAAPMLLEKRAETANTSRAAVVHARTLEMLEVLEVTPTLLGAGIRVPTFRVRDRDRVLMEVDFSGLDTRYPFTLMCPQDRTEAILRDRLSAIGGAITRDAEVTSVETGDGGVRVSVRRGGDTRTIAAKWVIGCDGGHSVVRDAAGIAFQGEDYEQVFALADARMDWPLPRDEVSLFFSPDGLVVIAPLPGDHFRIVATFDKAPQHPDAAFMERLVADRGPTDAGVRIMEIVWSSRFQLAHKVAEHFVKGRTILCGDAAHVHSPAGGQGMNTGIQDAISLAAPLIEALRADDRAALTDWADARRDIAKDVVSVTDRMTRAATMQSPIGRLARNTVLTIAGHVPGIPDMIARKLAELDRR